VPERKRFSLQNLSLRWGEAKSENRLDFSSISDQINIVKGANASGKSTTANAIKQIIWKNDTPQYIHQSAISAGATCAGDSWQFSWKYGSDSIKQNGTSINRTALSAGTQADRYYLSLQNLLTEDDSELARHIYNEMLGGYDLEKAKTDLGFTGKIKNRSISEHQELEEAIKKETELRQKFARLSGDEKKLERLLSKKEELEQQKQHLNYLDGLKSYISLQQQLDETVRQLSHFNPNVKFNKLSGDEWEAIEQTTKKISSVKSDLEEKEKKLEKVILEQKALDLPADKPDLAAVRSWKSRADDISNEMNTLAEKKVELEGQKSTLETHRNALNGQKVADDWQEPDYGFWDNLEQGVISYLDSNIHLANLKQEKKSLTNKLKDLGEPPAPDELDELYIALKQMEPEEPENEPEERPTLSLKTTFMILGVILAAVLAGAFTHWSVSVVVVVLAGITAYVIATKSSEQPENDPFEIQKDKINSSPLITLDDWNAKELNAGLNTIIQKKQERREYERLQYELEQLNEILAQKEEELEKAKQDLEILTEPYGNFPEFHSMAAFFQYLNRWNQIHSELADVKGLTTKIETLEEQIADKKERLINVISTYFDREELSDEIEELTEWLESLLNNLDDYNSLNSDKKNLEQEISHKKGELERFEEEKEKLTDLFPANAENHDLKAWCQQVDLFNELTETKRDLESKKKLKQEDIKAHSHYSEEDFEKKLEDIEAEKVSIEQQLERLEPLKQEIKKIENELYKAKSSHDLQEAHQRTENAWLKLMERKKENLTDIAGDLLYANLKQQTRLEQTPELLQQANAWFNQFTNGMYRLHVLTNNEGQNGPTFQAEETETGTFFTIAQLSSGTRIQLLLAVRLAYIEHQEGNVKLPLLIDELLANSDDQRAQQIINALITIAENGRQIFYFTAQSDEVIKWQKAANTHSVTIKEIALDDIRAPKSYSNINPTPIEIPNVVINVPAPYDMDRNSYAEKLNVPVFNPLQDDIASLHLWYALDSQPLYKLLQRGISRWSQFSSLVESNNNLPVDASLIEKLTTNIPMVDYYLQLRKTGHPSSVNEAVVLNSGAISETFRDTVSEKLRECRYNPEALLAAIEDGEIARFRSDKTEELKEYLFEEGYLKYEDTLSSEEIYQKLTIHLAKHPEADRSYVQKIIERIERRFTGE